MNEDDEFDALFDQIDDLIFAGQFEDVDRILEAFTAAVEDKSVRMLVGVLAITLDAKEHLKARPALVAAIRARLMDTEPDRVVSLLRGL